MSNPFNCNNPTPPEKFLGRWKTINNILNDLYSVNGSSHAIIAGKRCGKTSILHTLQDKLIKHLVQTKSGEWHLLPVLLDVLSLGNRSAFGFYNGLLKDICLLTREDEFNFGDGPKFPLDIDPTLLGTYSFKDSTSSDFEEFKRLLGYVNQKAKKIYGPIRFIFLIDEIDEISDKEWANELFGNLRSLTTHPIESDHFRLVMAGSQRFLRAERHPGSPLFNMFTRHYLEPFSDHTLRQLIARGGQFPPAIVQEVINLSGGHPYIAQFLMQDIWNERETITTKDVRTIASKLHTQHPDILEGWYETIGNSGRHVFPVFAKSKEWMSLEILKNNVKDPKTVEIEEGLTALLYHNLIFQHPQKKHMHKCGSELFRQWFLSRYGTSDVSHVMKEVSMSQLTWLHISDLHFREAQAYDSDVVLKELLQDVVEQAEQENLRPDFIAFTGDVAFSGQAAEYELARQFFDDLLLKTGLSHERLFIIPGNHDINRKLVTAGAQAISDSLTDRDKANNLLTTSSDRQLIFARFNGYADFINEYIGDHIQFNDEHFFFVRLLELAGLRIAILGLNSAWLCASDKDKTNGLLIGEYQTRKALKEAEQVDLKIVLLHHPFDWIREFDQNDSQAILSDKCDFILHGHLHRTAMNQLTSPDNSAMIIAGGACYETRKSPNSYNFVKLDFTAGQGFIHLRRYSDERGGFWTKDTLTYRNVPDGVYNFVLRGTKTLPQRSQPRRGVSHSQKNAHQQIDGFVTKTGKSSTANIDLSAIRRQLNQIFDDPELDAFCMENFPQVSDKFGRGMRRDEKINVLLDYCRRSPDRSQKLLTALARYTE